MDHSLSNGKNIVTILDNNGSSEVKKCNSNNNFDNNGTENNCGINSLRSKNTGCAKYNNHTKKSISSCCAIFNLIFGTILLTVGLVTIFFSIYDFVLIERLKMTPGFPAFEQWVQPAPEVRLRVFIFGAENADAFLDGTDEKLKLKEIGPIVYREYLNHDDIEFHSNSTLSYTAARYVKFLEDENEPGILNQTITVPNFTILATAASLKDAWFVSREGFKFLHSQSKDTMFVNISIYDYLWNYRSNLVRNVQSTLPFLVPTDNSGILFSIYDRFTDRYNVRIGPHYGGDEFFEITSVNGDTVVPGFNTEYGDCNATIVGSTEGAIYNTHLTNESVIWYWRKALCRMVPLHFQKTVQKGAFLAYKYQLKVDVYDRTPNLTADCYKGFYELLPNGLSDLSKCYFDMPFAASNPHFYGRYPNPMTNKLDGLNPIEDKHESYIIVEPTMGVPIDQCARSQSNVIIPNLEDFGQTFDRFSDMALPTFWIEYHQKELTPDINAMLIFTLQILPILQHVITALLILFGCGLITLAISNLMDKTLNTRKYSVSKASQNRRINGDIIRHSGGINYQNGNITHQNGIPDAAKQNSNVINNNRC